MTMAAFARGLWRRTTSCSSWASACDGKSYVVTNKSAVDRPRVVSLETTEPSIAPNVN